MRALGLFLVFALGACGQTASTPYRNLPQACELVRPAATEFLRKRGFVLAPGTSCNDCMQGEAKHLHDADGHRFFSNRKVIERYTTYSIQYEKSNPVVQKVHVQLAVNARLNLLPTAGACQAELRFSYRWYAAVMILGFPVDGNPSHAESNGKLEAEYLQSFQQQLAHVTVAQR